MGSKGGKSNSTQTVVNTPYGPSQPLLNQGLADAQALYDSGQLTPQPFGNRLAAESPYTMQARQGIAQQAMSGNPIVDGALASFDSLSQDPYRDADMLRQNALRNSLPAAAGYFENAGMLNSSVAQEHLAETAARAIAPIDYGLYNDQQNRRLSALSMAPQTADLYYSDNRMLGQAGQMADARSQLERDAEAALYYETEDQDFQNVARLSDLALGYAGAGGTQSGAQSGGQQPGGLSLGTGLQLFSLSDERAKTDIVPDGFTEGGTPVYLFRYKGDDQVYRGVMAADVPHAVVRHESGFDMVDYSKVV